MIRKAVVLVFLFSVLVLTAQDMPFSVKSATRFGVSAEVGKVTIESVRYYQLRIIHEFKYKKFGMGFDLDFLFDRDYHIRKRDWDHLRDIPTKIYYMRYAKIGDPYFFHLGGFPNYSIGNGLLMLNFSNMAYYPEQKNYGLLVGCNLVNVPLKPKVELFTSDLGKNQILALSAHVTPLPDSSLKYIDQTVLGLSVITDLNQKGNLRHVMGDSLYHATDIGPRDAVTTLSFDLTMPISKTKHATYGAYTEVAHIVDNGTGFILPGLYANFDVVRFNLEYRRNNRRFIPAYFDHYYEEDRAIVLHDPTGNPYIKTKEDSLQNWPATYGFLGRVQGRIGKKVNAMVAWQNMYGENHFRSKSLWFRIRVDTQYRRLENFVYSYSKVNVKELALGQIAVPRAQMSLSTTFSWNEKRRLFLIAKYSEKYKDKNGGINWWRDTDRSFSAGVKYVF
ncbi:MAG: hypothetical protein FJ042_01765 [Candidatus Cloacimonetes bacterium]|nr:hypothetical protein [Candidatus Cloacimonadota bacterium]